MTGIDLAVTVLESVLRDDDTGNAVLTQLVEPDEYLGFQIERIVDPPCRGAPLLVHASRRSLAAAALERLETDR